MSPITTAVEPYEVLRQDHGLVPVFVVRGAVDRHAAAHLSAEVCRFSGHDVVVDMRAARVLDAGAERDLVLAARVCSVRLRLL
jgi:hypothetical protein